MDWWLDETFYPGPRQRETDLVYWEDISGFLQIIGILNTVTPSKELKTFIRENALPS